MSTEIELSQIKNPGLHLNVNDSINSNSVDELSRISKQNSDSISTIGKELDVAPVWYKDDQWSIGTKDQKHVVHDIEAEGELDAAQSAHETHFAQTPDAQPTEEIRHIGIYVGLTQRTMIGPLTNMSSDEKVSPPIIGQAVSNTSTCLTDHAMYLRKDGSTLEEKTPTEPARQHNPTRDPRMLDEHNETNQAKPRRDRASDRLNKCKVHFGYPLLHAMFRMLSTPIHTRKGTQRR